MKDYVYLQTDRLISLPIQDGFKYVLIHAVIIVLHLICLKIFKKMTFKIEGNGPTDRQTNRPTNMASYRVARTRLKRSVKKDKDLLRRNYHDNVGKKVQGRM